MFSKLSFRPSKSRLFAFRELREASRFWASRLVRKAEHRFDEHRFDELREDEHRFDELREDEHCFDELRRLSWMLLWTWTTWSCTLYFVTQIYQICCDYKYFDVIKLIKLKSLSNVPLFYRYECFELEIFVLLLSITLFVLRKMHSLLFPH